MTTIPETRGDCGVRLPLVSHSFDVGNPNVPRFEVGRDGARPIDMIVEINSVIDRGVEGCRHSNYDECLDHATPFCPGLHIPRARQKN